MSTYVRVVALVVLLSLGATAAIADDTDALRSDLVGKQEGQREAEGELTEVRTQAGDARQRLEDAEDELEQAEAALAERRDELDAAREELSDAQAESRSARAELRQVSRQLERTETELVETQAQLDDRVRAAYKYGQVSFTEAFVGVHDITDFVNSTTYVGHVMSSDKELVDAVADLLAEAAEQRSQAEAAQAASEREAARAERAADEVEQAEADQSALTEQVAVRRAEQGEALEGLQQDADAIAEHLDALQRSEDQVRSQIAEAEERARQRLEAERQPEVAAADDDDESAPDDAPVEPTPDAGAAPNDAAPDDSGGSGPPPSTSGWLRPTDGRMTSGYGYRSHPVLGGQRLHAGVDLASPSGTPVRASRDGIVSFAGWMNGYGNTVMVSHGEGQVTLYAHLSSYGVSRDAHVPQGTVLGGVGTSGTATGPHLHFEVRVGGSPNNPCDFIAC